jgi:hypothetical protein
MFISLASFVPEFLTQGKERKKQKEGKDGREVWEGKENMKGKCGSPLPRQDSRETEGQKPEYVYIYSDPIYI